MKRESMKNLDIRIVTPYPSPTFSAVLHVVLIMRNEIFRYVHVKIS